MSSVPLDEKGRRNLAARVASAAVLIPVVLGVTVAGGWWFAAVCALAAALAAAELLLMWGPLDGAEIFAVLVAGAIPVMAALGESGDLLPGWSGLALALATVALLAILLHRHRELEAVPARAARAVLAWLWCGLLVGAIVGVRLRFGGPWVIMLLTVTFANDTFAYFAGLLFGRHKLYEKVSPKKTWEGFAGGALGSLAGAVAVHRLFVPELDLGGALVLGAGAAVLGPTGDLVESLVKRAAGKKDSGTIIPGHGGILDRIDALLFVAPWVYLFAAYWATRPA